MSKYARLDSKVFSWLSKHKKGITTARVYDALAITDPVAQRHISRRFTQLEDRGVLVCTLQRTMRVCVVVGKVPTTLAKKKWIRPEPPTPQPHIEAIPAEDSNEFEKAGGKIMRLESHWDTKHGSELPLGNLTFLDYISSLE